MNDTKQPNHLEVRRTITWPYFKRYSTTDIEKGVLWDIIDMQGKYGMWYLGSSVSFESVKSVMEYDRMLLRLFLDENATKSALD